MPHAMPMWMWMMWDPTLRQHLLSSRHADAHIVRFQVHSRDLAVFGDDGAAFASVLTENGGRVEFQVPGFG